MTTDSSLKRELRAREKTAVDAIRSVRDSHMLAKAAKRAIQFTKNRR